MVVYLSKSMLTLCWTLIFSENLSWESNPSSSQIYRHICASWLPSLKDNPSPVTRLPLPIGLPRPQWARVGVEPTTDDALWRILIYLTSVLLTLFTPYPPLLAYVVTFLLRRAKRSRRDLNPWPPPWQGGATSLLSYRTKIRMPCQAITLVPTRDGKH